MDLLDIAAKAVRIDSVRSTFKDGAEHVSIRLFVEGEGPMRLSITPERGGDVWMNLKRVKK